MNNIPTAEEFFEQGGEYPDLAIAFAKLHLEAALKAAAEEATAEIELGNPYDPESGYPIVNKQSILNAYPLDLIK
jgi:hypothetical protein